MPSDVDFRVMLTFVEFYNTLIGFVNFKLYHTLGLCYPPKLLLKPTEDINEKAKINLLQSGWEDEKLASLAHPLAKAEQEIEEDDAQLEEFVAEVHGDTDKLRKDEEKLEHFKKLFNGCRFFLGREVPRETLVFIIRSFGGEVSWDRVDGIGATFEETDQTITHQVIDRPTQSHMFLSRVYVQPQWIFDSVNYQKLLPIDDYVPGATLPPHLSPFVEEQEGDYIPPERQAMLEAGGFVFTLESPCSC
jgi:pescadillo protein